MQLNGSGVRYGGLIGQQLSSYTTIVRVSAEFNFTSGASNCSLVHTVQKSVNVSNSSISGIFGPASGASSILGVVSGFINTNAFVSVVNLTTNVSFSQAGYPSGGLVGKMTTNAYLFV